MPGSLGRRMQLMLQSYLQFQVYAAASVVTKPLEKFVDLWRRRRRRRRHFDLVAHFRSLPRA